MHFLFLFFFCNYSSMSLSVYFLKLYFFLKRKERKKIFMIHFVNVGFLFALLLLLQLGNKRNSFLSFYDSHNYLWVTKFKVQLVAINKVNVKCHSFKSFFFLFCVYDEIFQIIKKQLRDLKLSESFLHGQRIFSNFKNSKRITHEQSP